jgi:hypothetical protein
MTITAVSEKRESSELAGVAPSVSGAPRWSSLAPDVLVFVVLLVTAFVARRGGLPTDGLWHDDAWVAAGAVRGSFWQLFTVGSGHPGYTGVLMGWGWLAGGSTQSVAFLTLVAGTLGPPALYLLLRRLGYARSISALLGGTLVVGTVHVLYSGRVKPYVFDMLIVICLAAVVPFLVRVRWRWPTALAWVAGAILVSSFSGFAFVAAAVAGVILVFHAESDRVVRLLAVAAQAVGQLAVFAAMQQAAGRQLEQIEATQETLYDGHLTFSWNPLRFGAEAFEHYRRLAVVFPGGPGWWLTACALLALAGLFVAAFTKRLRVPARYLALILVVAFVGGVVDRFPFGPTSPPGELLSRGERSTIWLIPVMAVGLAAVLQWLRGLAAKNSRLRLGFDVVVYALAATVVATTLHDATPYPFPGSKSATKFIESDLGRNDVVLITHWSVFPYAVESKFGVSMLGRPEGLSGFIPKFADPRIHAVGYFTDSVVTPEQVRSWVDGADRVFVHTAIPRLGTGGVNKDTLLADGFKKAQVMSFDPAQVVIWTRQQP